jgi:hypothetical protein
LASHVALGGVPVQLASHSALMEALQDATHSPWAWEPLASPWHSPAHFASASTWH